MHFHSSQRFVALFAGISVLSTLDPQPVRAQQSPVITVQPTNQYPMAGGAVSFTVGATATMPLSYQWRKDGTSLANGGEISGATTTTLTLSNVQTAAVGSYSVRVASIFGAVTSAVATLQLVPVVAWGDHGHGQTTIPNALSNAVALAAGAVHSLALTDDGRVVGWGAGATNTESYPHYGQTAIPTDLSNVVALAAGEVHSLALTAEGRVVGWGAGATNTAAYPHYGQTAIPTDLSKVVALAAGAVHSLALTAEGQVVGWGAGGPGASGHPNHGQTTIPNGLSNVVAIAAGGYHSLALTAEGRVIGWGDNSYGQKTIPNGLSNVVAIAAGYGHSLALTVEGLVAGWGDNTYGQRTIPRALSNVVAIAAGSDRSLALTTEGGVVGWGRFIPGQPIVPTGLSNVVAITAGEGHTLALTGLPGGVDPPRVLGPRVLVGTVEREFFGRILVANGAHGFGASDLPPGLAVDPTTGLITGLPSAGGRYTVTLFATNASGIGQASLSFYVNLPIPGITVSGVALAGLGTGFTYDIGLVNGPDWVSVSGLPLGLTFHPQTGVIWGQPLEGGDFAVSVTASNRYGMGGGSFTLRVSPVVGWGYNASGQTTIPAGLSNVVTIAAGSFHSLALTAEGRVVGWGAGETNAGSYPDYGQNAIPHGLSNVVALAAGYTHSLALTLEGRVVNWGDNGFGQTTIPAGLSNGVAIAAGLLHSLALTAEGRVIGWGYNGYGQTNVPSDLGNVVAIAAGRHHSLALTAQGRVIGWGYNYYGQTNVPSDLSNVTMIAAGSDHSLALTTEGRVVGWGYNGDGQTTIPAGLSNVVAISAGTYHSLALTAEGRVVGWGAGGPGTSGETHYGQTTFPSGLSNVAAIAAGGLHSLALIQPSRPRLAIRRQGATLVVTWTGGAAPYQLQQCRELGASSAWQNVGDPVRTNSISLPLGPGNQFLRLRGP